MTSNDLSRNSARSRGFITGLSLFVASALGLGAFLLLRAEGSRNKVALASEPRGVTVVEARSGKYRATHRYVGTLQPWLSAKVGPQLASGYVDTVVVRPGDVVRRGAVLATLDCRNASASNLAIVQQARALEHRQKASAKEAARLSELLRGGFAAPNDVEQKEAIVASNDAQFLSLQAQASGKALEVNDCILRAPFDGEIALRFADPGSFVRPGTAIVDIVDRSVVRVEADVPETDNDAVAPKSMVNLRLFSTGKTLSAAIARRAPSADPGTRTIHFELDLPNGDRQLPVGTTADLSIEQGELRDAVEIPLLAAKVRGDKATIYVVEGGVAKKLVVDVLGERGRSLFVAPSLNPHALVVTEGRASLVAGERVAAKVEERP